MLYSKLGSTRITILYDQRLHYRFESRTTKMHFSSSWFESTGYDTVKTLCISKFFWAKGIVFFFQKEKKIDHPVHFTHTQSLPS